MPNGWRKKKLAEGGGRHEILREEGTTLRRADLPKQFVDAIADATTHLREFHMIRDAGRRCADREHKHVGRVEPLRIRVALANVVRKGYATSRSSPAVRLAHQVFCAQTHQPCVVVRTLDDGCFDVTLDLFRGHGLANGDVLGLIRKLARKVHRKAPHLRGCDVNGVACDHPFQRITAAGVTNTAKERLLAEIGFEMVVATVTAT